MITINYKSLQIPVLAMGKGWLAVDKPAGLTVHNAPGRDLCAITHDYIRKKPTIFKPVAMDTEYGIHPVHRLDKETSGVLLLAADREIFTFFSHQFETRKTQKRYVALLHGPLAKPDTIDGWGIWQWPLAKEAGGRKNPAGTGKKIPCHTRYRVIDNSAHYTLVEIEILTGRKHQIRRHAKLAKHPVVGDARYGSDRAIRFLKDNLGFHRLALHAYLLTIQAPDEDKPRTIETQKLPDIMRGLFKNDCGYES